MGHSQYGMWDEAMATARECPNVYLELTAVPAVSGVIEKMVSGGLAGKMLYGDDLPWFDPLYSIGCIVFARIDEDARHAILHRNAERVFEAWL
jgi:predicted TIM-barrel fold metal-dependent hydrolase